MEIFHSSKNFNYQKINNNSKQNSINNITYSNNLIPNEKNFNIKFEFINRRNLDERPIALKELREKKLLILFREKFQIINLKKSNQIYEKKECFNENLKKNIEDERQKSQKPFDEKLLSSKSFDEKEELLMNHYKDLSNLDRKLRQKYPESIRFDDNYFKDFIELKNKDLIIWSKGKIFYYKKDKNTYKLSQIIYEVIQQENKTEITQIGEIPIYNLNNVIELENNNLLSCNSIGIKIYNKKKNEYKLIDKIAMKIDVENFIKINSDIALITHHYEYNSHTCEPVTYHILGISLYNLKTKNINSIYYKKTNINRFNSFNYFLLKNYFFYQVYELGEEKKYNIYNIKTEKNQLDIQTNFVIISHYKDYLILTKENKDYIFNNDDIFHVCSFKNNALESIYKFKNYMNIYTLKNKDLVLIGINESKYNNLFYYDYYKYLASFEK